MTTFATLKSDTADWLLRDDLTSVIPSFVRLAEAAIRRDVRVRAMETSTTVTITAGSGTVPSDFISARRMTLDNTTAWALDFLTPEVMYASAIYNDTGTATAYTIDGDTFIFRPSTSETAKLLYLGAFDALSADTDTNWLLTNAYDVYLYGTLMHSAPYLKDDARVQVWAQMYQQAVAAVNKMDNLGRFSGAALKMAGSTGP